MQHRNYISPAIDVTGEPDYLVQSIQQTLNPEEWIKYKEATSEQRIRELERMVDALSADNSMLYSMIDMIKEDFVSKLEEVARKYRTISIEIDSLEEL